MMRRIGTGLVAIAISALGWGGPIAARALAVTFPVTTAADSGPGSLRDAIMASDTAPGADTITFSIGTGPQTIAPASALPAITDPVSIDGTSQPGYAGTPLIRLDGSTAGAGVSGLVITAGSSTVRGLEVTGWSNRGIELQGGGGSLIAGNYIGTDGGSAIPNTNAGVIVYAGSAANTIGGTTPADRNVVSGNGKGIVVSGGGTAGNLVEGNYIGTNAAAGSAVANVTDGILVVNGANGNTVGGTLSGSGNVSSGNGQAGVDVTAATGNVIEGNFLGTDAAGDRAIGNLKGVGIGGGSPSNVVGGTTAAARNVISGNRNRGVVIGAPGSNFNSVQGNSIGIGSGGARVPNGRGGVLVFNHSIGNTIGGTIPGAGNRIAFNAGAGGAGLRGGIGVLIDGGNSTRNAILANSIYSNSARIGIALTKGGNANQPAPRITSVLNGRRSTRILGRVARGTTRVELFVSPKCGDPEGKRFLGARVVKRGRWSLRVKRLGSRRGLTATATRVSSSNTSRFSKCVRVPRRHGH